MKESIFSRAAYYLSDYASVYESCVILGDKSEHDMKAISDRQEMLDISQKLKELSGSFSVRRNNPIHTAAAIIVADIVNKYDMPASVWYNHSLRKFRIAAEGYKNRNGDVLVGVYLPSVTVEMLEEDFELFIEERKRA